MRTVLCILFLLLVGVPLLAEEGGADKTPDLPKELSQFDFVIGEWDVHIFWRGKDGKWVDYNATWRCSRLAGEYMVHQDWDGPYLKGSEFKAWDKKKKKWQAKAQVSDLIRNNLETNKYLSQLKQVYITQQHNPNILIGELYIDMRKFAKEKIFDIKCDDEANKEMCDKSGVPGFPSVVIIKDDTKIDYSGPKNAEAILEFINNL